MRGEFIRGDGLVIPNNITTYGAESILRAAMRRDPLDLHIGLANCDPSPTLDLSELNEPTIGTNGYARQTVSQDSTDWEVVGDLSGEPYIETREFVFAATDSGFDKPITRPVIVNSPTETDGQLVVAVGTAVADEYVITPDTPIEQRTFKYRIYAR